MLLCILGTSGVLADDNISCSAYLSATAGSPTVTNCTFKYFSDEGSQGTVPTGTESGSYYYSKMNNNLNYYEVTLSDGTYTKFKAGDVINVYLYANNADPSCLIGKTPKTLVTATATKGSNGIATHTLTAAEIEADGTVRIYRNTSNTFFEGVSITGTRSTSTTPTAPTIAVASTSVSAYMNVSTALVVTVDGYPDPTVTWYQNTSATTTGGTSVGTGAQYSPDVTTAGTYYYYAVASNSEGDATSEVVTLTVENPDKEATDNAYYMSVGEKAINGEKIVGDDITMTFTHGNVAEIGTAIEDGNIGDVNTNMVASVSGSVNGWSTDFVATKAGTLKVGVIVNNDKQFSISGVTTFKYQKKGAEEVVVESNSLKPTEKLYVVVTIDVTPGTTHTFSVSGSKMGFYGFEFTPAAVYTTVYNIAEKLYDDDVVYEGNQGTVSPTTAEEAANAPDIQADATNGKLGKNNQSWAQILENTVLTLPGVPEGATLTFSLYDETALTIDGIAYTNGQTYTSNKDQDVVMTCTTSGYIATITVVGTAFVESTDGYTNTWYFGKKNGAPVFELQKSPEYEYVSGDYSLMINTDAGKLNNASRTDEWAQCNDGTLFKVPVFAGSKLTWGRYNQGSTTGFIVDGKLYNENYVAAEDGIVNISASGISYLSFIKIEPVSLYEISGTISGGSIDGASVLLTAANGQVYEAQIASGAFTTNVPGGTYAVSLSEDVAFVVDSPDQVTITESGSVGEIVISAATPQTVTGQITNAPSESFTLTFTGNSHNKNVECAANATSFEVTLDPDTYTIGSSVGTLSPLSLESFKVVKDAATHNIYFPEEIPAATQQEITVDNTATVAANVYNSVSDALAAAKAGSISAPIISLTSGQTYREQVIVDMANVTLKTTGTEKAKITFYYGIGYCYYSLNSNGYYDKDRAMTRNSKLVKHPARWGTTVLVTKDGNNFKADNIIFENSFNQYYTNEEVVDGVEAHPMGDTNITYDRTLSSGEEGYKAADAKDVTERAAAIAFENNPTGCQVYDCVFIGSQDTYYTSGYVYAKNCDIQGNTDYIFGGGHIVFDNCNLVIGGYSDKETSAYITAQKGNSGDSYIFRDCTVTQTDRTYVKANLGRDWGGASATVYFFNLKNEIGNKLDYKWSNMGGGVAAGTANLHIYDFDPTVNANYSTTGSTGANVNGLLSDADALGLYAGVVSFLGFTPERIYEDNLELGDNSAYNICRVAASDNVERTVELTRSITAGNWSTIVLPFAMTEAQLKDAFGENVKVAELVSGTESKLNFSYVTATEANKPYAIKVAAEDNYSGSATIENVTVVNGTPTQGVDNWSFVGVYDVNVYMPVGSYFFTNNQIKKVVAENTNKIKPFRAYFAYSGTNTQDAIDFSFDGEPTAIETLSEDDAKQIEGKFIVDGQLVVAKNGKLYNAAGAVIK
jgi:pectin methylesterase-like acyl-CoA thioesterase